MPRKSAPAPFAHAARFVRVGHRVAHPDAPTRGRHVEAFLGHPVRADVVLLRTADVAARLDAAGLDAAGLDVEQATLRSPSSDLEYSSRRAYVWARTRGA